MSLQIVRRGHERWEINRVERHGDTVDLETIGWVIREVETGLYHAWLPRWLEAGVEWHREDRGYLTRDGALRVVRAPRPSPS